MRWIVSFVLFLAIGAAWALASPIYSGPDEPSHVIHIAAIPRGELIGREVEGSPEVEVEVPRVFDARGLCYAFHPEQPASCFDLPDRKGDATLGTYTARFLPVYSGYLGFGSYWFPPGAGQIYLMRLLSVVLIAALLASCVTTVAAVGSVGFSLGFLFALTPMALYFMGIVNPSSPEIAAGIATWTHGVALTHGGGAGDDPRLIRRFGIAACVLCATRPLSPLWVLLTVIVLVVVAGRPRVEALIRRRVVQGWAAAVVGVALIQVVWSAWAKPLGEGNTAQQGLDWPLSLVLRGSIGKTYWSSIQEMIGRFGWLDTRLPSGTIVIFLLVIGALLLFAVTLGSRRFVWAMALTLVFAFVVPVVIESARASANNLVWHGRYSLPFSVGIPILGGYALRNVDGAKFAITRLAWWVGVGWVVAQMLGFGQALRRYTVGATAQIWYFLGDTSWSPPVPAWLLTFGYLGVITALAVWVVRSAMTPPDDPPAQDVSLDSPVAAPAH